MTSEMRKPSPRLLRHSFENKLQVLTKPASGDSANHWMGPRHPRDNCGPGWIFHGLFDEGVAGEGDPHERVGHRQALRLQEFVKRPHQLVCDSRSQSVQVLEMNIKCSLRDARLLYDVINGNHLHKCQISRPMLLITMSRQAYF